MHKELGALEQDRERGFSLSGDLGRQREIFGKKDLGLCVFATLRLVLRLRIHVLPVLAVLEVAGSRTGIHAARSYRTNGLSTL